jgi:hypothetical protein
MIGDITEECEESPLMEPTSQKKIESIKERGKRWTRQMRTVCTTRREGPILSLKSAQELLNKRTLPHPTEALNQQEVTTTLAVTF